MNGNNAKDTLISCPKCNGTIDLQFFPSAQEVSCPHCSGLLALPEALARTTTELTESIPSFPRSMSRQLMPSRPPPLPPILPTTTRQSPAPEQHQQTPFQQKNMLQRKNIFWVCCGLSVLIIAVTLTVVITLSVSDKRNNDLPKFSSLNNYASGCIIIEG